MKNIRTIFWDFDGVILDSMNLRDWGFREIFKSFDAELVEQLIEYHRINGGLSRYVKIRHFYEKILNKAISEEQVMEYANQFSVLMKQELTNKDNLIMDSVRFIENNFNKCKFHVVSGSDQTELRFLCKELGVANFFLSIHGSPTPKTQLVKDLLDKYGYDKDSAILIGDSLNDYDAAVKNNISFYGYNNEDLKKVSSNYIPIFETFLI